jgi:hypothetical protein
MTIFDNGSNGNAQDLSLVMLKLTYVCSAAGNGTIDNMIIQAAKDVQAYFGPNLDEAIDDMVGMIAGGNPQALDQLNRDVRITLLAARCED